jgi:hypothetical protein
MDEKIYTFWEAVETMEDFLSGYLDESYKAESARMESFEKDPMETQCSADGQMLVADKIDAMKYIRKKFQALMRLMARKNLLLQEDMVGEI